jgi:SpoIID/LytB domain protein
MRAAAAALLVCVALAVVPVPAHATGAPSAITWTTPVVRFEPEPGTTVAVDGIGELRGTIELRRAGGGVAVINELSLEDYLLGLAEVPSTWPAAALEAQAIAARTFAVRSALVRSTAPHRVAGADICATQACQVYDGIAREARDVGGAWAAAVRATANRLVLHEGAPILAKYASSNGGHSDDGGYPYLPATPDPDDAATSPHATWRSVVPLGDVERALPGAGRLVEVNRAADVVVLRREQPDRSIVDQGMAPLDFRRALNTSVATPAGVPVPVPSHRFVARTDGGSVVLDGAGYGHLVGMSQYGALGKARRGMAADDILASYYGGLRSTAVDPAALPPVIRVAVALDEQTVTLQPVGGRFRVRAADGAPIAQLARGAWSATATGETLSVEGAVRPIALRATRVVPEVVRVELASPANVEVHDPAARSVGVLDAGVHDLPVAAGAPVVVVADAGGGRVERVDVAPVPTPVPAPLRPAALATAAVRPTAPSTSDLGRTGPAAVAALAAGVTAVWSGRLARRGRR